MSNCEVDLGPKDPPRRVGNNWVKANENWELVVTEREDYRPMGGEVKRKRGVCGNGSVSIGEVTFKPKGWPGIRQAAATRRGQLIETI